MNTYIQQLDELREGIVSSISIGKEEFFEFREVLIQREDFKHFRGTAKQGGFVIYTYEANSRS